VVSADNKIVERILPDHFLKESFEISSGSADIVILCVWLAINSWEDYVDRNFILHTPVMAS
jgi:hypothetical protein